MPCNCTTNNNLDVLAKIYGSKKPTRKKVIGIKLQNFFYWIFAIPFAVLFTVPFLLYLLYKVFFGKDKGIHFDKFFNLK